MYQSSTLTLQMFISCGGLNVLVDFLEEDLETERDLVLIGVNGVWSVFELQVGIQNAFRSSILRDQGPTPKNDFCRIFSRSSVLYPLSLVLNRVLDEAGELAGLIQGRIVNIFLLFSQAENHVKEIVADRMVLKSLESFQNYRINTDSLFRSAERSSTDGSNTSSHNAQIHQKPINAGDYS